MAMRAVRIGPPPPRVDGVLLAEYREHAGRLTNPACGCSLDAPDRDCNVGYSLFVVATRNRDPVRQDCMLALMR